MPKEITTIEEVGLYKIQVTSNLLVLHFPQILLKVKQNKL